MRRLRQTAQVALHCLRIVLHVCVAVPALGKVQRRSLLPLSKLCCVELVCRQFTVAFGALVQTLLPCFFSEHFSREQVTWPNKRCISLF